MNPTMIGVVFQAWILLAILFAILWLKQRSTQNATSVDAAWSGSIALLSIYYAIVVDGDSTHRILVGLLGALWGGRLTYFLLRHRVWGHTKEDGRYRAMRDYWGTRADFWFFLFYQGQAAVALLFSLPILGAMTGSASPVAVAVGVAIWVISVGGETLADRQLARFRADPTRAGQVCREGLWRYSRHPNYFFEWIHWWAYVLIGGGALLTWLGPPLMLLFLFRLTGIPYTELQALKSRGEAYREYQRTTSVFVPWPPKG